MPNSRRQFLNASLSAAVAGSAISCGASHGASPWRFFTAEEGRTVDAICERIIPADRDLPLRTAASAVKSAMAGRSRSKCRFT